MDVVLIVLAVGCFLVGIAGSILPALPGPPLSYLGIWLVHWSGYCEFTGAFLLWTGVIMLVISIADYFLPPLLTKKSGGSGYAATGSIIGMIAGLFFTPVGMLAGLLLGAFAGEFLFARKDAKSALKAALGAFAGFILGTGVKLLYCFFAMASPFFYGG
ncbi:MAG: DUF456 domain-containing protein [Tannerellaceae bacterium]|jgi:uncharacterized protein YqgC (DUF456 family)|nr:DUF456 domain-containing protein [Tannerellaceae bacterium]